MERYVIRDTDNAEFVSAVSYKGIETEKEINKAIIIDDLEKAKSLLNYIDFHNIEEYQIEEIQFKVIEMED